MPIYDYFCVNCESAEERNVSVADRDNQYCGCDNHLHRQVSFKGVVYAPTATNGGMK